MLPAVRSIVCIVSFALLSQAFGGDPGQVAIEFIRKVKAGEVDLAPGGDTALREQTSLQKRKAIAKSLKGLEGEFDPKYLEIGDVNEDGQFAAAIVRYLGDFDSMSLQVYPVALVKKDEKWSPAPVLGSFENAIVGYTIPLKRRLDGLEYWMMQKRVTALRELVAESDERVRKRIKMSIVGEDLEGSELVKITELFFDACQKRNQAAILGYLGGLSEPLPEDWKQTVSLSNFAVSREASASLPWRLVVSPDIIRVPVGEEVTAEDGSVFFAFLDPKRSGSVGTMEKVLIMRFDFEKDPQGRWKIVLPSALEVNDEDFLLNDDSVDDAVLDLFTKNLRERVPSTPAKTVKDAVKGVTEALVAPDASKLMGFVDFGTRPRDGRASCAAAAAKWWSLNEPGHYRAPLKLGAKTVGDLAVVAFQWFSANQPDQFNQEVLYFKKLEDGWIWSPRIAAADDRESQKSLVAWLREQNAGWQKNWQQDLLKDSQRFESISLDRVPTDEQVRTIGKAWIRALDGRDLSAAILLTAWLGAEGAMPAKMLRNLSYELSHSDAANREFLGVFRNDSWAAAGIKSIRDGEATYSFVPIMMPTGTPRILPEIDLLVGDTRTRKFLNEASFERIVKATKGEDRVDSLRNLFESFSEKAKKN
ncbi:MAG: hypothetical protein AB8D78_11235 [Akkermansiaceae bacterium]